MIASSDRVRGARSRLSLAATNYLDAIELLHRLSADGNDPGDLEVASRKVAEAQVRLVAAMRVHGEVWRSQHSAAYRSFTRQLEAGPPRLVAGFARMIGGRE